MPLPPVGEAVQVTVAPVPAGLGEATQVTVMGLYTVVVQFELVAVLFPASVTVTAPVLVPVVEYIFDTEDVVPDKLSVPDQLYVYGAVPPV